MDDDINILNSLKRLLRKDGYTIFTSENTTEALDIFHDNSINMVLCDQRMPGMSGTEFLSVIREKYPDVIRIVLTGYTDIDTITESINKGHIFKFILKPWDDQNLRLEIRQGLDHYDLIQSNKRLHETIIRKNEELEKINRNLEHMVSERTKDLEIQNQALELSRNILQELSVSVLGISNEKIIVFQNKKAGTLISNRSNFLIGKDISECFPDIVVNKIEEVFKTGKGFSMTEFKLLDGKHNIEITPLTGNFAGKGLVLVLYPLLPLYALRLE